ncbi:MAG: D-2-hydroxyacid dehydrogenase [Clostridia bacterium]|nr:D-2-hydroxyacid dehydrogenase [Clostridia bacterium]
MKILVTDAATVTSGDIDLSVLAKLGELTLRQRTTPEELIPLLEDCDVLLCNKTVMGRAQLDAAPNLKYIGLFATGYNNIDTEYARERGVTVCNAGSYSTDAVCQQVFAYILDRAARVRDFDGFVKDGGWMNSATFSAFVYPSFEISGKTLGIVGYGAIGRAVANAALAFGMKVLVCTRTPKEDSRVSFVDMDTLLSESDFVSVHCPLNAASANMFNYAAFKKMKPTAMFINTGRGGIVVEADLRRALDEGVIAFAAVDVLCTEPMSADCPLFGAKNILFTPHVAWAPLETRKRVLDIVFSCLEAYLAGRPVNVVN